MAERNSRWSRKELLVAFNLYCQMSFGKMHKGNPEIIRLASLIGRTPSSVAMKLVNFASLDPAITSTGRTGLGNASVGDKEVWGEFHKDWERLALESKKLLNGLSREAGLSKDDESDIGGDSLTNYEGSTKAVMVEVRIKQSFFRKAVLGGHQNRCCISGVKEPKLLIASHIVPWSEDKRNRLNPRNGLCLSALHDRAFDQALITVTPDYRVQVSKKLKLQSNNPMIDSALIKMHGKQITLPEKFWPGEEFLTWHNRKFEESQRN